MHFPVIRKPVGVKLGCLIRDDSKVYLERSVDPRLWLSRVVVVGVLRVVVGAKEKVES